MRTSPPTERDRAIAAKSGRAFRRIRCGVAASIAAAAAVGIAQVSAPSAPLNPLVVQSLAPLLAMWIGSARDAAKAQGVAPIPAPIRAALEGYVPDAVLARVRWRQGMAALPVPQDMLPYGDVPAMTLDDVILFKDRQAALEDPKLWAHELKHVMQFEEWGVDGFAARYLSDYEAVEKEAAEFRWAFMKRAGLIPPVARPAD